MKAGDFLEQILPNMALVLLPGCLRSSSQAQGALGGVAVPSSLLPVGSWQGALCSLYLGGLREPWCHSASTDISTAQHGASDERPSRQCAELLVLILLAP